MGKDRPDPKAELSLGERAAIARMERALFGGEGEVVSLGRYEIVRGLGRGAFGRVYEARDPQLRRTVALKVLPDASPERIEEARLMATVAHPNVAAVYDAGGVGAGEDACAFIAMELVSGQNLREWRAQRGRSLGDILDVMIQAGRGLAAAHAAGVVHRDFKPENVLVGVDGRVRVVDFGLARAPTDGELDREATVGGEDPDPLRTASGVVLGTPAYMAPAQLEGRAADPASDQFAFAVTVWELVHGERPFAGRTLGELVAEIRGGRGRPWRRGPAWLGRVVRRGLAAAPEARFPSMEDLLAALRRGPARWPRWLALATAGAVLVGAGALLSRSTPRPPANACGGDDRALATIWSPDRRHKIEAAFQRSGKAFAADAWQRARAAIDRYGQAWVEARRDACATAPAAREGRLQCLDDRRRQLAILLDVLEDADAVVVQSAVAAAHELPALAACVDPPEERARPETARPLYEQLDRARALHTAGRAADALAVAEEVQRRADELRFPPLQAAAAIWRAEGKMALGLQPEAVDAARRAFDLALTGSDERAALYASTILAFSGAFDASKKEEALKWVRTGQALAARLPGEVQLEAKLANAEGNIYLTAGDARAARAPFERTIAIFTRLDADHPNLGSTVAMLGIVDLQLGDAAGAEDKLTDALARVERTLGGGHPEVASTLVNLSLAQSARGRYARAEESVRRALDLQGRIYGHDHPLLTYTQLTLGLVLRARGRWREAEMSLREAERVALARFGPAHPVSAQAVLARAEVLARTGRAREALAEAQHGREILTAAFGPEAPEVFLAEATLAEAQRAAGGLVQAIAHGRRAVALLGASRPEGAAIAYQQLGEALLARGQRAEGAAALAEAEKILEATIPDPIRLAEVRGARARALRDRTLAAAALAAYPPEGDPAVRTALQAAAQ